MNGRDSRTGYSKGDAEKRDGCTVEEDADEEADTDQCAGDKDQKRRAGVEHESRGEDGEREDKATSHLVEGGIDVFECEVAQPVFF